MSAEQKIAVIGAGAWGTALAIQLARNGNKTQLWGRDPNQIEHMASTRHNSRYLPDAPFPEELDVTSDLATVVTQHRDLLLVVPSHTFRSVLGQIRPHLSQESRIIWATKGLEVESGQFLHQVVAEELGEDIPAALVSGPSFATELGKGLPTAMTAASHQSDFLPDVVRYFHGKNLRMYTSEDVVGVELGGAVKNVLAIAAGISDGLGFGANARAALITRGLAELMRLGVVLGARRETLMGLSGVGDLVLTCTDDQSRNRRLGLALGQGKTLEVASAEIGQALEGVKTASVIHQVAKEADVEMPISNDVHRILHKGLSPRAAVAELLSRELKNEF
ncbi:MAG TPA: NAD(P)-dependent glycerol-3-phosphate dehydrogenase [Chromatiales bacterium]|nr:NAD(P)-dependent glycerol-3-phosphate dehydrogenase [Chromatiales bacterium]